MYNVIYSSFPCGTFVWIRELGNCYTSCANRGRWVTTDVMSAAKRRREEEEGNLAGSKKQLFADVETDAPVVCAIDFGTARTGIAYAFTKSVASEIKVKEPGGQEPGRCTHMFLTRAARAVSKPCQ